MRTPLAVVLLVSALCASPAQAQFSVMDNNSALRMGGVIFMAAGGAGFLATWLGFPFYVQDQHFEPCRGECSSEFGVGFVPLAGPWVVLGQSRFVAPEASIGFGVAQIGSLALLALGIVMWGVSENPQTGQPEFIGAPMMLPGGGGAFAALTFDEGRLYSSMR